MDTLITEDGRQYIRHYLIDFGSILGSAGYSQKEPWMGHEYAIARPEAAKQMVTFGFYLPRWVRSDYPKLTGVGLFDAWSFDPVNWKPNYPNPSFLMMDPEDAFWAAKQIAAFTDDEIRAIVKTGEFSDPRAADWIADCLIQRRDKIAASWFGRVLPLDKFRVTDNTLAFDNLTAKQGTSSPDSYQVQWAGYDNSTGAVTKLTVSAGAKLPLTDNSTSYLAATITCGNSADGTCINPLTVYLRRSGASFEVVGVDRKSDASH
jgi:hypothetical protein